MVDHVLVADTGILYDLVASPELCAGVQILWAKATIWIPPSVIAELRHRQSNPGANVPPQLPTKALGLLQSNQWDFQPIVLTPSEQRRVNVLQRQLGDINKHAGECEAAVYCARHRPPGTLLTDDLEGCRVLKAYVQAETGQPLVVHDNQDLLNILQEEGHLSDDQRSVAYQQLQAKDRPLRTA